MNPLRESVSCVQQWKRKSKPQQPAADISSGWSAKWGKPSGRCLNDECHDKDGIATVHRSEQHSYGILSCSLCGSYGSAVFLWPIVRASCLNLHQRGGPPPMGGRPAPRSCISSDSGDSLLPCQEWGGDGPLWRGPLVRGPSERPQQPNLGTSSPSRLPPTLEQRRA